MKIRKKAKLNGASRGPMGAIGAPVEKAKDFKGTLKRLLAYLKPRRLQLLLVLIMAILSTAFSIISPKVLGLATTKLFEGSMARLQDSSSAVVDFQYIGGILKILMGLYLVSALFSYIQQFIMAGIAQKTVYDMRNDVNHKLAKLPLGFFDSRTHGEILSRVTNDVDNISSTLQQSLTQLITSVVTLVGVLVMMLTISPLLTLVTMVILPLSAVVTAKIAKRSQVHFASQQKSLGELNGHVEEMYTGHRIIKVFNRESDSIDQFKKINDELYESGWKAQFISGIIFPLLTFVNNIGYVIISVAGGIMVTRRTITIGDIQAFIQYARQFTQPIAQTANIANILQSTVASAERVFELLDEEEEIPDEINHQIIELPRGAVQFDSVNFSYKKDEKLIEDMNIKVQPGETIAIVGPTGAGKTTLVNLLMRFYEIDQGKITVDGVDIRDLKREDLRRIFGMVLQDTWLFNGTIEENIAYGRRGASHEDIVNAARVAQADYFIRTLPDGYQTVLNEEASNISQGQKQLITIARAFLADPAILILDEATSSVDTRTEIHIQRAMVELMKGRTSFVIAHRLSTIKNADLILVMNEGRIIEKGSHWQLLKQKGFYADLYNSQFTSNGYSSEAI
ncbi:ABC transporter ATP-binding protein [Alkaliphilus crotonatoxidans]